MKIAFFEARESDERELSRLITENFDKFSNIDIKFYQDKLDTCNIDLAKDADIISVFINSEMNKDLISSLSQTRYITTRSTGFDHIDHAFAKSRHISVSNVPAYGSRTVAEFTLALILGLSRKVFEASYRTKVHHEFDTTGLMGFDLFGKTMGIVGTGKIGGNVARIAKGFGMHILAYDVSRNEALAIETGLSYVSDLGELLEKSDIVSLHTPYCKATHHLINLSNVNRFKRGSFLINTARGEICDSHAILKGLDDKRIVGVGLDVIEGERSIKKNEKVTTFDELVRRPEVFITPHLAYYTKEAQNEISKTTIDNILAFLKGEVRNAVN